MARYRRFSAEFRIQAVRLMKERVAAGDTLVRVGEELGLDPNLLWSWGREVDGAPTEASPDEIFPGNGRRRSYTRREIKVEEEGPESPEQELKRLRKENERLRQERDFLKKAAAFFAKESQ